MTVEEVGDDGVKATKELPFGFSMIHNLDANFVVCSFHHEVSPAKARIVAVGVRSFWLRAPERARPQDPGEFPRQPFLLTFAPSKNSAGAAGGDESASAWLPTSKMARATPGGPGWD